MAKSETRKASAPKGARPRRSDKPERRTKARSGPAVPQEQRRHMAVSCAFFKAEQYREASGEAVRASDVEAAERAIAAAIEESAGGSRDAGDRK